MHKRFYFLFLFFLFSPLKIFAASFGGIGIEPVRNVDFFSYELGPGQSIEEEIEVVNHTDTDKKLILKAFDARDESLGVFELITDGKQESLGKWITFSQDVVTLGPQQSAVITFYLTVSQKADVGKHAGAIVVQADDEPRLDGTKSPFGDTHVGIRIFNTVPGEVIKKIFIESFKISEKSDSSIDVIEASILNQGNRSLPAEVHLIARGVGIVFQAKDSYGGIIHQEITENTLQLSPGVAKTYKWIRPQPYLGRYSFQSYIIYDSDAGTEIIKSKKIIRWYVPWNDVVFLGMSLFFAFVFLFGIMILRKRKEKKKKLWREYSVDAHDNIIDLGKRFRVEWKEIAHINKIKKPYALIPGSVIYIPLKVMMARREQENVEEYSLEPGSGTSSRKGILRVLLVIIIILLGIFVFVLSAFLYVQYKTQNSGENINTNEEIIPSPTPDSTPIVEPTPEASPTPEPTPKVKPTPEEVVYNKAEVSISVLNGNGISGYAGTMVELLNVSGFTKITTGNADSYDYKSLKIIYQSGHEQAARDIRKVFANIYSEASVEQGDITDSNIVIILGATEE